MINFYPLNTLSILIPLCIATVLASLSSKSAFSVALTKFLVNDIKRQGRGELQGTGNVIYKLLEALEPIEVLISACDVEEFSLKLTQWGAIFEMEIN